MVQSAVKVGLRTSFVVQYSTDKLFEDLGNKANNVWQASHCNDLILIQYFTVPYRTQFH